MRRRYLPESIRDIWEELEEYIEMTNAGEILRRYFVMNAFDGALTVLGFVMGAHVSGLKDANIVLTASVSMSFAMGVSGFVGAFITEKAEREKKKHELEEAMLTNLDGTTVDRAAKFVTFLAALVDALAPAIAALVCISPFVLVIYNLIIFDFAFTLSTAITLGLLFLMGIYLGRVAKSNELIYGIYMLVAGLITSIIISLVGRW